LLENPARTRTQASAFGRSVHTVCGSERNYDGHSGGRRRECLKRHPAHGGTTRCGRHPHGDTWSIKLVSGFPRIASAGSPPALPATGSSCAP
jgi:hypothetical protein